MSTHYDRMVWIRENKIQKRKQTRIRKGFNIAGNILTITAMTGILIGGACLDSPSITGAIIIIGSGAMCAVIAHICHRISCME